MMTQLPNHETEQHANITIFGDVQGVFFRRTAKLKAESFGVNGFIRNEPDGTVYIEIEGPVSALKKFLDWCQAGPEHAAITSVESEISDQMKNYYGFEIR
jgi:acylphosphatase